MAQFVKPSNYGLQQPGLYNSQGFQQPVQPVQNRFVESQSLIRRETPLSLRLRKFLFYSPIVFFLVLLISSSVIYGLRFKNSNSTTPAAVKTLQNLGESFQANPILEIRVLPKYKKDDVSGSEVRNTCKNLETLKLGTDPVEYWDNNKADAPPRGNAEGIAETKEVIDRFEEVVFNSFGEIREGCVCTKARYGKSWLTYHNADYCEEKRNCQIVRESGPVKENVVLGSIFCVRRVRSFSWKKNDESCDKFEDEGKKMRECGQNLCVSSEEGLYDQGTYKYLDKNLCPISRIEIVKRSSITNCALNIKEKCLVPDTDAKKSNRDDAQNTREVIHFRNKESNEPSSTSYTEGRDLVIVTWREKTNRPIIDLKTSISSPLCLADDYQKPQRTSHNMFKLQQPRESGCWPYGAHLENYQKGTKEEATYQLIYGGISQETDLKDNDVNFDRIANYKQYIMNGQDVVNLYAVVRPRTNFAYNTVERREDLCREYGIEDVAIKSRRSIQVVSLIEEYSYAFIISSSIGLALSILFVLFRHKRFVNPMTQLYLHLYVLGNAIAVFVYAVLFWVLVNKYQTSQIQKQLNYLSINKCFMYDGQIDASNHINYLLNIVNNQVFGFTTFLFVVDLLYLLGGAFAVFVRRNERLNICEPATPEALYYE